MSRSLPGGQHVDLVGSKCQGGLSQGFHRAAALPPQTHLLRRVRRLRSVCCISLSPLGGWGRQEVILRVCLNFSKCVFLYMVPPKGLPALARFLSSSHFCVCLRVSPFSSPDILPPPWCFLSPPPTPWPPRPPALFPLFLGRLSVFL